jgi:hypothetical protein
MISFRIVGGNSGMNNEDSFAPTTVQVLLRQAENGFVANVYYPPHMVNEGLDLVKKLKAKADEGDGEGVDPMEMMSTILGAAVNDADPSKRLRKLNEEYVFKDQKSMLSFVEETFTSSK